MKLLKHKAIISTLLYCLLVLSGPMMAFSAVSATVLDPGGGGGSDSPKSDNSSLEAAQDTETLDCATSKGEKLNEKNCGIILLVKVVTNVLAGIAGVVIVGVIIWGGIQYSMAGADPSKVQAAKQRIFNALIALVLFIFGFALLQWLIPGGALNGFR